MTFDEWWFKNGLSPEYHSERNIKYTKVVTKDSWDAAKADAAREVADLEASLNLIHDADHRGIKMWQEATGRDMEWPDRGKLIFWLLEKLAAQPGEQSDAR